MPDKQKDEQETRQPDTGAQQQDAGAQNEKTDTGDEARQAPAPEKEKKGKTQAAQQEPKKKSLEQELDEAEKNEDIKRQFQTLSQFTDTFSIHEQHGDININHITTLSNGRMLAEELNKASLAACQSYFIECARYGVFQRVVDGHPLVVFGGEAGSGREYACMKLLLGCKNIKNICIIRDDHPDWQDLCEFSFKANTGYLLHMPAPSHENTNCLRNIADRLHGCGSKLLWITQKQETLFMEEGIGVLSFDAPAGKKPVFFCHLRRLYEQHAPANVPREQLDASGELAWKTWEPYLHSMYETREAAARIFGWLVQQKNIGQLVEEWEGLKRRSPKALFEGGGNGTDKIFSLTVAMLEGCPLQIVAEAFQSLWIGLMGETDRSLQQATGFLKVAVSERCQAYGMEVFQSSRTREYGVVQEKCIRFQDDTFGPKVIRYAVQEFPQWRQKILDWAMDLAINQDAIFDIRSSVGLFLRLDFESTKGYLEQFMKNMEKTPYSFQAKLAVSSIFAASVQETDTEEEGAASFLHHVSHYVHHCAAMEGRVCENMLALYIYALGLARRCPSVALADFINVTERFLKNGEFDWDVYFDCRNCLNLLWIQEGIRPAILKMISLMAERQRIPREIVALLFLYMLDDGKEMLDLYSQKEKSRRRLIDLWLFTLNQKENCSRALNKLEQMAKKAAKRQGGTFKPFLKDLYAAAPENLRGKLYYWRQHWKQDQKLLVNKNNG